MSAGGGGVEQAQARACLTVVVLPVKARVRSPAQDMLTALPWAEIQVRVAPVARVVTLIWLTLRQFCFKVPPACGEQGGLDSQLF